MSLLPPDYWKNNQGPLIGSPDPGFSTGGTEQTYPTNPTFKVSPIEKGGFAGGMGGQNDFLKYLMKLLQQQGQNNQQPQNPIGPSLPGASQRGFLNRRNHFKPHQPGDMVNNGWGGMMPYDPNFTGVT